MQGLNIIVSWQALWGAATVPGNTRTLAAFRDPVTSHEARSTIIDTPVGGIVVGHVFSRLISRTVATGDWQPSAECHGSSPTCDEDQSWHRVRVPRSAHLRGIGCPCQHHLDRWYWSVHSGLSEHDVVRVEGHGRWRSRFAIRETGSTGSFHCTFPRQHWGSPEHGWQRMAGHCLDNKKKQVLLSTLSKSDQTLLRSPVGLGRAVRVFAHEHSGVPHSLVSQSSPPLPFSSRLPMWPPLDASGHHRSTCAVSGVLGRRGFAIQRAAARICRKAVRG